eukprot:1144104-Pyramimonas_sp.AAC.1
MLLKPQQPPAATATTTGMGARAASRPAAGSPAKARRHCCPDVFPHARALEGGALPPSRSRSRAFWRAPWTWRRCVSRRSGSKKVARMAKQKRRA